ncbi:hypothetical protein [Alteribacter natronophilus]|uniref:hypothetical protein n=1 Tax=Alteribacter natronophilus TaxID=2583810 RepID=UPI00110E2C03|nr:hypothetical protein [Alteribacter natronophilus]TMW71531.1 hypothetical protein FGB90_10855 [Alteribacter natronophilus]
MNTAFYSEKNMKEIKDSRADYGSEDIFPEDKIIDFLDRGSKILFACLTIAGIPYLLFLLIEAIVRLP